MALYMLAGAAVFSSLERSEELKAQQLWKMRMWTFSQEHNISHEELKSLLRHYDEARTAGIHSERGRALWDFPGAFYFVGTVVSTIGFGVTAPSTIAGKVLLVFYGLLGCSATILFCNLFLERVVTFISLLMFWCSTRRNRQTGQEDWKPSAHQVTLVLLLPVLLVACVAASMYSTMEGWTYLESLYFCFVAFSTVGFGDFVSVQKEHHEDIRTYQVANCLLMLLGVCCTYSLFHAISEIIRKGLNRVLSTLNWMFHSIRHNRLRVTPSFKFCFSECECLVCCHKNDPLREQKPETAADPNLSVYHGKSFHSDVLVETISYSNRELSVKREEKSHYCENNVCLSSLRHF